MAYGSSSRTMQYDVSDGEEEEMVEEGADESGEIVEEWTVDSFKSYPLAGDSAASMVRPSNQ